ncbi:hypothetical protein [Tenacibaculum maritimum]|uniref:hypothetical protein n=1 Tax=Tenacibaculum maritimum TaxID=107401 RepID=UPI003876432F
MKIFKKSFLLVALLVLFLILLLSDGFKSLFKAFLNNQQSSSLDVGISNISDNEAALLADTLYVAMGSLGTDFDAIYRVFESINKEDYYKIHNKFGDRGYIDFIGVGIDILFPKLLNLKQWLDSELSNKQKSKLIVVAPYLTF